VVTLRTYVRVLASELVLGVLVGSRPASAQDVEIEIEDAESPPPPPEPDPKGELRDTVRALEERVKGLEEAAAPVPPPPVEEPAPIPWTEDVHIHLSGWVQPQVLWSQLSQDEVGADGQTLNLDRFMVRRGRIELAAVYRYVSAAFELDANTTFGPAVTIRGAEAAVFYPQPDPGLPPFVKVKAGMFDIPFGFTTTEDADDRFFMERTVGSRALFPGDSDVGAEVSGGVGPFRYNLAVTNGVPISEHPDVPTTVNQARKTFLGRLGVDARPEHAELAGGVSYLSGAGFHQGTPPTKSSLSWSDDNQDGLVTLNELTAINGQASTPSATFDQWAVGADTELGYEWGLGWSRLWAEVILASNLDRGLYVSDPIATGYDLRQLAWNVGFVQEGFTYGVLGFRADGYTPDSDLTEARRGAFQPVDTTIITLSPIVGVQIPEVARLLVQYDYVSDLLGRDALGEPADLPNDVWTVRLQVEF
jgi:hypothetical protein